MSTLAFSQSNNPVSIYEGEIIQSIKFNFSNLPKDTILSRNVRQTVENKFKIYPQTQYSSFMTSYYLSQVNQYQFVTKVDLEIEPSQQGSGLNIIINVELSPDKVAAAVKKTESFPALLVTDRLFLTSKFAASQMAYSNNNAWFAQPDIVLNGNPLVDNPVGRGYTAWLEGFASAGVYGIAKVIPKANIHIYAGANYLASFSAGPELFTNQSRFYADIEEAYAGFVGGGRTDNGHNYKYGALYGRKQFVLGDGFLLINTSMNGSNRAALQLNPRWAARNLLQFGFSYDRLTFQAFRLEPNELPILNSHTVINGLNLELGNRERMLLGASFLQVPQSNFKYYFPDGSIQTRKGLQVYNLRLFRSAAPGRGGLFFKVEGAYERNPNFDMSAFAFYGEAGWNFAHTSGNPSISYRFAMFSGDNPDSKSFNRWDALYTGGNGEQWVQGSNMYKMVQNSNELSHRVQFIISPARKLQLVTQLWLFYAPQTMNLGGNPALSIMKSKFYGSELNLTLKYFKSRNWYFHLNTAYTIPGGAIRDVVPGTLNWFCLSAFARYSF